MPHGSADVERAFSESKLQLPQDRISMSERVVDARQMISDVLKNHFDNCGYKVAITDGLLKLAQEAHRNYQAYLEADSERIKRPPNREKKLKRRPPKLRKWRNIAHFS